MGKYIVGITGASGSIYGKYIVEELIRLGHQVYLVATEQGEQVFAYELEENITKWIQELGSGVLRFEEHDFFSSIASGSFQIDGMVIVPCSMGSLGKIAGGISDNLLIRSADVTIKEKRPLVLVPRETPLSPIHLENMLKLSKLGITIVPPMPAFYCKPKDIHTLVMQTVGRILEQLGVSNRLYEQWGINQ